jgi:hypothetical protein
MSKVTQRFIVGTGRCGSTLLSTLMSHHPDALVLSEFFGGLDVVNSWREGQVSGEEFGAVLMQDHEISNLNRMRLHKDREVLLDVDRFASVRIPAIMLVCLPALTPDVEGLMREIVAFARSRATATMGEHYAALFDWLTMLFKKQFWIERSGASSEFFPGQRAAFPEARFLHIHRGGHEAAMSMANMHHFQTHVGFYYDPPSDAEIANAIRGIDDGEGGLIARRQQQLRTPEEFGRFWTLSVALILSEVKHLRPDQYREFRFEDLHADPPAFLRAVCGYFEISADDGWIAEAVSTIRPERHQRAEALSPAARAALDLAVFPGNVLLKRDSLERPNRELYARIRRIWDEIEPSKAFAA